LRFSQALYANAVVKLQTVPTYIRPGGKIGVGREVEVRSVRRPELSVHSCVFAIQLILFNHDVFKTMYEISEFKGRIKLTGSNSFSCAYVKI